MKKYTIILILLYSVISFSQKMDPLRIGIVGMSHSHVHWLLGGDFTDVEIVGIVEPNKDLAMRYAKQYDISPLIIFESMDEMIKKSKPEAVTAFGSIYDHLEVVEKFAPLGIHIMVEKPLAVSVEHALKMEKLANKYKVHLLTNYETTWYPSNHETFNLINSNSIGSLRKIVVHDGHEGPIEIGVNQEFLDWLCDPVLNGGGAITDFGCYGANLITWLMKGQKPISVTAKTQQIKPHLYPNVDDDATIILQYSNMQGIIMASWNWPFSRKDMEVYGKSGYILVDNSTDLRIRFKNDKEESYIKASLSKISWNNPFSYFAAVVRNKTEISDTDLSSLSNNLIVVEILEAAKKSAASGKTVFLTDKKQ